jgi:hypothetical protein
MSVGPSDINARHRRVVNVSMDTFRTQELEKAVHCGRGLKTRAGLFSIGGV